MTLGLGFGLARQQGAVTSQVKATGGTESTVGAYHYHLFTTDGSLVVLSELTADYLIVAGGGGGGRGSYGGGGGGAGGCKWLNGQTIPVGTHTITVGGGGNGRTSSSGVGSNGGNTSLGAIDSVTGGGGGGGYQTSANGQNGGSGGGGGYYYGATPVTGGTATSGQGYDGGAGVNDLTMAGGSGGGGGKGAIGNAGSTKVGGNGGNGLDLSAIIGTGFGALGLFAGGGGGSTATSDGTQGLGKAGGGNGSRTAAGGNATDNTGSGGGGGANNNGGNGGSGVVIVRYLNPGGGEPSAETPIRIIKTADDMLIVVPHADKYVNYRAFPYNQMNCWQISAEGCGDDSSGISSASYMQYPLKGDSQGPVSGLPTNFSNGYIYGNHGIPVFNDVRFTTAHGLSVADIGEVMVRSSDDAEFMIIGYGLDSYGGVYVRLLGEPTDADLDNTTFAQTEVDDVLVYKTVSKTVSISSTSYQPVGQGASATFQYIDGNGDTINITSSGYYSAQKVIMTNTWRIIHPKSLRTYIGANKGNHVPSVGTCLSNADFFPTPQFEAPELVRLQDMQTVWTIYDDATVITEDTLISNAGDGGYDVAIDEYHYPCIALMPPLCKMYIPKVLGGTGANALLPANATSHAGATITVALLDPEFDTKESMADRNMYLTADLTTGSVMGAMLDVLDDNIATRFAALNASAANEMTREATSSPAQKSWIISKCVESSPTYHYVGYGKYLINPYPDVCTAYYTVKYGDYTYLYVDFHKSTPESYSIPIPSNLVGQACELIEKTNALTISGDISVALETGMSASYTYDAETAPYAFAVFKFSEA